MTARYVLTAQAKQDLADIAEYVAESSGLAPAEQVVRELQRGFQFLADQPDAGHGREELTEDPGVRFWSVFSYLIAYVRGRGHPSWCARSETHRRTHPKCTRAKRLTVARRCERSAAGSSAARSGTTRSSGSCARSWTRSSRRRRGGEFRTRAGNERARREARALLGRDSLRPYFGVICAPLCASRYTTNTPSRYAEPGSTLSTFACSGRS